MTDSQDLAKLFADSFDSGYKEGLRDNAAVEKLVARLNEHKNKDLGDCVCFVCNAVREYEDAVR